MLERLVIKNVALIESAQIEFCRGLNIMSGETGSGKSVILDSLNFVLGSKADRNMIRYGAEEASVRGEFTYSEGCTVEQILKELDIEADGQLIITRRYSQDGRGSIKVNGNAVTSGMLKKIAQHLVDVYGQSEHFTLLSQSNQLAVIDELCGHEGAEIKERLSDLVRKRKERLKKMKSLGGDAEERARRLDLLSYQIDEIERAELDAGEEEELINRRRIIENTEKIASAIGETLSALGGDGCAADCVSAARRLMAGVATFGNDYDSVADRLDAVTAELNDIKETLSDLSEGLEFDGEEARRVEDRLDLIRSLKRKYGADIEAILAFRESAAAEYELLSDSGNLAEKLNKEIAVLEDEIYAVCLSVTKLRKSYAQKFCKSVEKELKSLNISGAKFSVQFTPYDRQTVNLDSADGSDKIEFMFSANAGEPLKPLDKVISGGELSRFMLAIKTQLKELNGISTYLFDEIDAGISGVTANKVAEKFIAISRVTQVIAVSHLPQICASGDANFFIYKSAKDGGTLTHVERLDEEGKIGEIVRLTGGSDTEAARRHAKELIMQYNNNAK